MKKDEVIKLIEEKGDTSYVVRTEADDKTFLENYGKSVLEKELDPAISKVHNQYDDDLEKIFGKRKKPGEKTYNFMKSEFQGWKERADKVEQLETEIESLKKGSPEVEAKLREIKTLQGQINDLKKDYETKIDQMSKQNLRNNVKAEIERGLMGLKIKAGIPESMQKIYVDSVINELSEHAEIRDGKIVFLDEKGVALRDPSTMAPYTAESLLKERMKDVIDTGRMVKGPGIGNDEPFKKDGKVNVILPDHVKNRVELGEYLVKELGIKRNTKEYMEAYAELGKELPAFPKK